MVHYAERFTQQTTCEDLMELVMHHLEPFLSDVDLGRVLLQFDWESQACEEGLKSKRSDKWPARSWKKLALLDTRRMRHFDSETHVVWVCEDAGKLMRMRPFSMSWESSGAIDEHKVSLGLRCHGTTRGEKGFFLSIKVGECELCDDINSPCQRFECLVEFWPRVHVVENGCDCDMSESDTSFQGYVAADHGFNRANRCHLLAGSDLKGEVLIRIMDEAALNLWTERHNINCGLVFGVRLFYALEALERVEEGGFCTVVV